MFVSDLDLAARLEDPSGKFSIDPVKAVGHTAVSIKVNTKVSCRSRGVRLRQVGSGWVRLHQVGSGSGSLFKLFSCEFPILFIGRVSQLNTSANWG